ncbi:methyl-accepting chemotaxis protein [Metabacillus halosaccharovorans]|uniref:Methyl-accepting chemotaxis protein n=1 Tax=Metabacillus halosaccharovorans TaxID=930124 RepID=A0ABT3DBT7_9BACI|nr:HAMP domain-containing methyl-accepting chemotaxis protein [Metabacillus halosaccharovorans]MCV9884524.1 methyl-accepting chemotaxis protein [Metabacillus halosaccharovorans]
MKLLRNLKMMKKLLIIIIVSALSLGTVGYMGLHYINSMAKDSEEMYKDSLIPLNSIMQIRVNARASDAYTIELLVTKDPERNIELRDEITSAWEEADAIINDLKGKHLSPENVKLIDEYTMKAEALSSTRDQVIKLALENKNEDAYDLYLKSVEPNRKALNETLKSMQQNNLTYATSINDENTERVDQVTAFVFIIIIIALILLVVLSTIIARMIVKPIREMRNLLSKAENGDFTGKGSYQSKDEMGELTSSYNQMSTTLQSIFTTVNDSTQQVASAAEELSASAEQSTKASEHVTITIQELASGSDVQVQNVDKSSEVMNDIMDHTKSIFDNTEKITNDVLHASKMSQDGNQAIEQVNKQMDSIYNNVTSLSQAVKSLDERTSEIGQISNVISGISAQTNLLALNAAIEAARAGEHGKGFAVVADEVRKLAEESNKSTEQISNLISLIQKDAENTLNTMNKASEEVNSGIKVVNTAGSSFQKIDIAVNNVVSQIEDISKAVKDLTAGTEHVTSSINEVSEVAKESASITQNISAATEEQLASMEEISASSQSLATLADDLQNLMKKFNI